MTPIEHIKEDWLYRLPYRLDHMKFTGVNRPAYTILCLLYYSIKSLLILYFTSAFIILKFLLWDLWKWIFRFEPPLWYYRIVYGESDYDDEEEDEEEIEQSSDDAEIYEEDELAFCQLFKVGDDMSLLIHHIEMCPDETAFIRVVDDEGYTPLYKRKVRRTRGGSRYIVFNGTDYYLDDDKTQPIITRKDK